MIAISAARVYGAEGAATPEGHPILLLSPIFDTKKTSPVRAIAQAAQNRFGIMIHPTAGDLTLGTIWEQTAAYKVVIANRSNIKPKHEAMFLFTYLPEQPLIAQKLAKGMKPIPDDFSTSWYLQPMKEAVTA